MSESRSKSVLGGKKSESKKSKSSEGKKPDEIHIRKGASGGFIAKHHHKSDKDGNTPDSSEHVLSDLSQLHDHIDDQMGDQPDAGSAPSAMPAPPPPAAAPGQGAGMPAPAAPAGM